MISVSHLVKRYGPVRAVSDVSFEVGKGEVVGFLGPNGAGKSTTLRILAGFLGATSGTVTVAGHDVAEDSFAARSMLGYMPEAVPLYPEMRVEEYLRFRAELKGVARGERTKAIGGAMEKAAVADRATTLIGKLSKGYRQRVGLADALVSNPPLLILDEPTAGLDPNQIRDVRALLKALGEEHTVLVSTHILSEVEATCSRAIVIAKGKLVAQGTLDQVRKLRRPPALRLVVRGEREAAERVLGGLDVFGKIAATDAPDEGEGVVVVRCSWPKKTPASSPEVVDAGEATERAVAALVGAGLAVRAAAPEQSTLEEVFAELTRDEPEAPQQAEPDNEGEGDEDEDDDEDEA